MVKKERKKEKAKDERNAKCRTTLHMGSMN